MPFAIAELRGEKIVFAIMDDKDKDTRILYHSFTMSSFWHNSLHKLFVSFDETRLLKCYYGCDWNSQNLHIRVHNQTYPKQINCNDSSVHLVTKYREIKNCETQPVIFVIDNENDRYLIYKKNGKPALYPQKRAPLNKAWRP